MRHTKYIVIWMMNFLFCIGTLSAQKAERKNIREGNKLYKKEQFTESEIAYRKGVDVNPRSTEGIYNLGNALYKQEKLAEAAEQYQLIAGSQGEKMLQTSEGKRNLASVYHNAGNIFMKEKDYGKSVEAYKQSLRLNPEDDETRYNLALAQKFLEDQQNEDQSQNDQNDEQEEQDDQNQDQQQDQNQQQDDQKEDQTQEQEQPNEQMSKDNAQQILDAFLQDEKDTQEKVKKAQMEQQERRRTDKEW